MFDLFLREVASIAAAATLYKGSVRDAASKGDTVARSAEMYPDDGQKELEDMAMAMRARLKVKQDVPAHSMDTDLPERLCFHRATARICRGMPANRDAMATAKKHKQSSVFMVESLRATVFIVCPICICLCRGDTSRHDDICVLAHSWSRLKVCWKGIFLVHASSRCTTNVLKASMFRWSVDLHCVEHAPRSDHCWPCPWQRRGQEVYEISGLQVFQSRGSGLRLHVLHAQE